MKESPERRYKYALINKTKAAVDRYSKAYLKSELERTFLNISKWKCNNKKVCSLEENSDRPKLLSDEMLQKSKDIIKGHRN